jgi:hypothetical protein
MARMSLRRRVAGAAVAAALGLAFVGNASAQTEPLRVRRNFFGMHNLKDGGPPYLTGFHWTKNLVGDGFVFDWVFNYAPNDPENWVADAIEMGLIPCVRVQEGSSGDLPDPSYAGGVAAQICQWKLQNPQYADRYVYMALWNEPGDPRDYVPMPAFADYMVAAHAAVHDAEAAAALQNPDIAGTLLTMTPGQNNPDSWLEALQHNPDCAFAFDVWGSHPYPESYPPHYNMHEGHGFVTKHKMIDGHLRDLDVFAQYGRRGVRVMITETAYGDHLGISYEGYPKTTRAMAADYNVEAFGYWWYRWPEIVAVHPYILSNVSWPAFEWCYGGSVDTNGDGVYEPTNPYPQYTDVKALRESLVAQGRLAPARVRPYRGPTGTIQGVITRSDTGQPVKYANVYTDGFEFGGPSLFDGMYVVYDMPVGTYTLSVEKRGYIATSRAITVNENQTTTADFSLVYTGKVPKGFYFVDCGAPGLECMGSCPDCSLSSTVHGQTFVTPPDVGFIKYAAAKPNVGDVTLHFSIVEGDDPNGPVVGSFESYYLEPGLGGEMIGGEAPGDGIPVEPNTTYTLRVERTDGQPIYLYTSNSNPYPDGYRWVGNTPRTGWDLYGVIRGNTVEVVAATGSISGAVTDLAGNPIAEATVSTDPGNYIDTTNTAGAYAIADVPIGTYTVTASAPGYAMGSQAGVVVAFEQTATVDFALEFGPTAGTIAGTIRDAAGQPLAGAVIETTSGGYSTVTAESGTYALADVAPGTYTVRAGLSGYVIGESAGNSVTAGQITTVNVTLGQPAAFSGITNEDFEGGSHDEPDPDHRTANGWTQFTSSGFSKSGVTWLGSGARSADYVQDFWEGPYVSGVYQSSTATPGGQYTGSVWVRGDVAFQIGIDPTGGTWAGSGDIEWSSAVTPGSSWNQISKTVTAEAATITLFLRASNTVATSRNAYFDDAALTEDFVPPTTSSISRTPADLSPVIDAGQAAPPEAFTVSAAGEAALIYSITDNAGWLSVAPAYGISTGEADAIAAQYDTAGLPPGTYVGLIEIRDPNADNNPQTVRVTLTVNGQAEPVHGDADGDGDVDLSDYAAFLDCYNGPGAAPAQADCDALDFDADGDVDLSDYGEILGCYNGPGNAPACE